MQHMLYPVKLKGMTGIRTTLKPGYDIIVRRKHIRNFPFPFVAPLEAKQNINFHLKANFL
ncbi:hypothetical protein DSECCO2_336650 [anaerobic digester metagenome]